MKLFPILRNPQFHLPWEAIALHEAQAQKNHGQTLKRLAERGGLNFSEACSVMEDRPWAMYKWTTDNPPKDIDKYVLLGVLSRMGYTVDEEGFVDE